jgi:hypothetical protein
LGRVGSWMKHSWRKSKESLMDGIDEDDDDDCQVENHGQDGTEEEEAPKVSKHVHFSLNDDSDTDFDSGQVVLESMNEDENDTIPFTDQESKDIWYQSLDFQRFEKDRVLTAMSYTIARRLYKPFVEDAHSLRGIEHLCDESLQKRQVDERKKLYKSIQVEEVRQKGDGSFPDLERFRSVSLKHSKAGKVRALTKASEDAREQHRETQRSSSMKNLFRREH